MEPLSTGSGYNFAKTIGYIQQRNRSRRIIKELSLCLKNTMPKDIYVKVPEKIWQWYVFIKGSPNTLYAGGIFKIRIQFGPGYPEQPPDICFITSTYHPRIHEDGTVSLNILNKGVYNENVSLSTIITAVRDLLHSSMYIYINIYNYISITELFRWRRLGSRLGFRFGKGMDSRVCNGSKKKSLFSI